MEADGRKELQRDEVEKSKTREATIQVAALACNRSNR